eukprot:Nk52_evm82s151 gene=Nk52_evmTU82s151
MKQNTLTTTNSPAAVFGLDFGTTASVEVEELLDDLVYWSDDSASGSRSAHQESINVDMDVQDISRTNSASSLYNMSSASSVASYSSLSPPAADPVVGYPLIEQDWLLTSLASTAGASGMEDALSSYGSSFSNTGNHIDDGEVSDSFSRTPSAMSDDMLMMNMPLSPVGSTLSTGSSCHSSNENSSPNSSSSPSERASSEEKEKDRAGVKAASKKAASGTRKRKSAMTPEEKRAQLLDKRRRNKIAAEKCRKKKRESQMLLGERHQQLEIENTELKELLRKRDEEIKYLKSLFSMAVKSDDAAKQATDKL